MRTFYNGYGFSEDARERLYNPTLSLYFLKTLQTEGGYPRRMLDENLALDRSKLIYISNLPHGEDLLIQALNGEAGVTIPQLARRFGVQEVLTGVKDQSFMASLLYYFGILTLTGLTDFQESILNIPNLVARSLYVERLREWWLPAYEDQHQLPSLGKQVYRTGDLQPVVDFIEQRLFPVLSNRDYRWTNELAVKLAFLTLLFDDRLYMLVSETEMGHGYIDLSLIRRLDRRDVPALDLLFEFKYVALNDLGLSGQQVRELTPAALAARPPIAAKLQAAAVQARAERSRVMMVGGVRAANVPSLASAARWSLGVMMQSLRSGGERVDWTAGPRGGPAGRYASLAEEFPGQAADLGGEGERIAGGIGGIGRCDDPAGLGVGEARARQDGGVALPAQHHRRARRVAAQFQGPGVRPADIGPEVAGVVTLARPPGRLRKDQG
jgi:hypothetical protein